MSIIPFRKPIFNSSWSKSILISNGNWWIQQDNYAPYYFDNKYRSGKKHGNAGGLSHRIYAIASDSTVSPKDSGWSWENTFGRPKSNIEIIQNGKKICSQWKWYLTPNRKSSRKEYQSISCSKECS